MKAIQEITEVFPSKITEHKTLAELAVIILSKEWPLSLNFIHQKITKGYGKTVSLQAVHKSLAGLVKQNILLKQQRQQKLYKLNPKWLEQVNDFSTQTKEAYAIGGIKK